MIKEIPILFSAPMVRAILEGRKTQTRRIVKLRGKDGLQSDHSAWRFCEFHDGPRRAVWQNRFDIKRVITERCPYGISGDYLWVRETFWSQNGRPHCFQMTGNGAGTLDSKLSAITHTFTAYRAQWGDLKPEGCTRWKPAIHMPRALSRINLEVTHVRVEPLQDITESDAMAEGAEPWKYGPEQCLTSGERGALSPYRSGFACLWDEINADRATWKSNPWVWVIEFKRI